MLSSFLNSARCAEAYRQTAEGLRRVLGRARSGVSLAVLFAFLHGQVSWSMGTERLIPGESMGGKTSGQQATPPRQPGEVQQPQQTQPQQPLPEGGTTVVTVSVPKNQGLDITVLEGEGESNVVGKKSSRPLVQVRDEKNALLEGAVVTFIAPADGPSVVFGNGLRTVTVMTDAEGRARVPSMKAVNSGTFHLQVSASFRGQVVSTSISQTNFESAAEAKGKTPDQGDRPVVNKGKSGLSGTAIAIIIGAGAAAAVGIGVGLGHKGSSSSSTSGTSTTIGGPGTPTVGAP